MDHALPAHVIEKVHFVDALWFEMVTSAHLKTRASKTLHHLFARVDVSDLVFVFLPVLCRC